MQRRLMIALLLGSALFSAGPARGEKAEPRREYPPEKVETAIWAMTQDHLSSVRDMKKQQVENYFANLIEQARLLAADAGMVKILKDLRLAFPEYQTQTLARIEQCCSPREELQAFYAEVVKLAGWFAVMEKLRDNRRKTTLDELAKFSGLSLENYSRKIADIEWTECPNRALRPLVRVSELRDWLRAYRLLAARYGEETDILDEARVAYYPGAENPQPLCFNPAPLYGFLSQ